MNTSWCVVIVLILSCVAGVSTAQNELPTIEGFVAAGVIKTELDDVIRNSARDIEELQKQRYCARGLRRFDKKRCRKRYTDQKLKDKLDLDHDEALVKAIRRLQRNRDGSEFDTKKTQLINLYSLRLRLLAWNSLVETISELENPSSDEPYEDPRVALGAQYEIWAGVCQSSGDRAGIQNPVACLVSLDYRELERQVDMLSDRIGRQNQITTTQDRSLCDHSVGAFPKFGYLSFDQKNIGKKCSLKEKCEKLNDGETAAEKLFFSKIRPIAKRYWEIETTLGCDSSVPTPRLVYPTRLDLYLGSPVSESKLLLVYPRDDDYRFVRARPHGAVKVAQIEAKTYCGNDYTGAGANYRIMALCTTPRAPTQRAAELWLYGGQKVVDLYVAQEEASVPEKAK